MKIRLIKNYPMSYLTKGTIVAVKKVIETWTGKNYSIIFNGTTYKVPEEYCEEITL